MYCSIVVGWPLGVGRWGLAAPYESVAVGQSLLVSRCELVSYCGLITMGWSVAVGRSLQNLRKIFFSERMGAWVLGGK